MRGSYLHLINFRWWLIIQILTSEMQSSIACTALSCDMESPGWKDRYNCVLSAYPWTFGHNEWSSIVFHGKFFVMEGKAHATHPKNSLNKAVPHKLMLYFKDFSQHIASMKVIVWNGNSECNRKYRKDSCISRTFLLKFWVKNRRCGLYTRPLI